jgi:hypothetical protein
LRRAGAPRDVPWEWMFTRVLVGGLLVLVITGLMSRR